MDTVCVYVCVCEWVCGVCVSEVCVSVCGVCVYVSGVCVGGVVVRHQY